MCFYVNQLNSNSRVQVNTYHNVYAYNYGAVKTLVITNNKGISTTSDFNYGTLPTDLRPTYNVAKWVNIRGNVTAYLEIKATGEVLLNHISANVGAGTWIAVHETYL